MIDAPCVLFDRKELNLSTYIDPIFDTNPLLTPYYRKINHSKDTYWYIDVKFGTNATPYQFFVLTTRLRYHVPLKYEIDYKTYQYNNIMKYVVDFGDFSPMATTKNYQPIINNIINTYHEHCMFLHMNQSFIMKNFNKPLPNHWVISVLPYCYKDLISLLYDPILNKNEILININPNYKFNDERLNDIEDYYIDYNKVYDNLQDIVIEELYKMYNKGVVVADPIYDNDVINEYQLYVYNNNINLYMTDMYIENKTEFLIHALKK